MAHRLVPRRSRSRFGARLGHRAGARRCHARRPIYDRCAVVGVALLDGFHRRCGGRAYGADAKWERFCGSAAARNEISVDRFRNPDRATVFQVGKWKFRPGFGNRGPWLEHHRGHGDGGRGSGSSLERNADRPSLDSGVTAGRSRSADDRTCSLPRCRRGVGRP